MENCEVISLDALHLNDAQQSKAKQRRNNGWAKFIPSEVAQVMTKTKKKFFTDNNKKFNPESQSLLG